MNGFTITESIPISTLGIEHANSFVTIKDCFSAGKYPNMPNFMGMNPGFNVDATKPYIYSTTYYIYAQTDITNIQPLKQESISISFDTIQLNPTIAIYTWIKANKFAGLTCNDLP